MQVKFIDLFKINNRFIKQFQNEIYNVILNNNYINGTILTTFENKFAQYCGTHFALGCGNGFDALKLILRGYGFNKNDEIIVPANTFIATALAVSECNCKLVLADVDPYTCCLSYETIKSHITNRTKAVIIVHLYGLISKDIFKIKTFLNNHKIKLIEDAAQAHGAKIHEHKAGSIGDAAAFSFYPTKNLGALGDGGAITTNDYKLYKKIKILQNYGQKTKYKSNMLGINSRLDCIQAAFLQTKLYMLDKDNAYRRKIAQLYYSNIYNKKIRMIKTFGLNNVYHIFPIFSNDRLNLQKYLNQNGIKTLIHYPIPIHKQIIYKTLANMSFPITEQLCATELSIPIYPTMNINDIQYVITKLNAY